MVSAPLAVTIFFFPSSSSPSLSLFVALYVGETSVAACFSETSTAVCLGCYTVVVCLSETSTVVCLGGCTVVVCLGILHCCCAFK